MALSVYKCLNIFGFEGFRKPDGSYNPDFKWPDIKALSAAYKARARSAHTDTNPSLDGSFIKTLNDARDALVKIIENPNINALSPKGEMHPDMHVYARSAWEKELEEVQIAQAAAACAPGESGIVLERPLQARMPAYKPVHTPDEWEILRYILGNAWRKVRASVCRHPVVTAGMVIVTLGGGASLASYVYDQSPSVRQHRAFEEAKNTLVAQACGIVGDTGALERVTAAARASSAYLLDPNVVKVVNRNTGKIEKAGKLIVVTANGAEYALFAGANTGKLYVVPVDDKKVPKAKRAAMANAGTARCDFAVASAG